MKWIELASVGLVAQFGAHAALAGSCTEPTPFTESIPDGATASRDTMLATQRAIKAYDLAVKAFTDCLHADGEKIDRGNSAVQRLEQLASLFNDQLKLFKARNAAN